MKQLRHLKWGLLLFGIFFCYKFIRLERTVSSLDKRIKKYKSINKLSTALLKSTYPHFELPPSLKNLPLADQNLILDVKTLPIRNVYAPYNPSIIDKEGGYYLFFRYDLVTNMHTNKFISKIGLIEIDENLCQTEKEYRNIDTQSDFSEDPRVFQLGEEYYMTYNDLLPNHGTRRGIYLCKLDLENNTVVNQNSIELYLNQVEKNWAPFVVAKEDKPLLCFEYQLASPRKILEKREDRVLEITHSKVQIPQIKNWAEKWGTLRGGAPARLVDGEYLSFFHSSIKDAHGTYWYVFGAYTFEANSPFRITKMSQYPILFKGMYDTLACNTAERNKRILFPSGFTEAKKDGKEVIYLSCGENDSGIKILTLDKEALLKSMQFVE